MIPFNEIYDKVKHIRSGCHSSELEKLYYLASEVPQDGLIVEVGSYLGSSAATMAEAGRQIICIDMFKEYFDGFGDDKVVMEKAFKENTAPYGNIKLYNEDSAIAKKWIRRKIDLLFIDGDHSYEGVKKDILNYVPKVKKGGIVVFHDYNSSHVGVKQAVDELPQNLEEVDQVWSMMIKRKI